MFERYDSIENSFREKHVAEWISAISSGRCEYDFVVEEKDHGANFSFYIDGISELKTACRSWFSQSHLVKQKCEPQIRNLHSLICGEGGTDKDGATATTIWVIGELIGGAAYDHPDVDADNSLPRFQKGVCTILPMTRILRFW